MEDIIKELEVPVGIESIPAPIPDIVEPPNNNLRDAGIVAVSYTHLTLKTNPYV